jgi:integrase
VPQHATLTELALRAAKPPGQGTTTLWDGSLKHFGVRISQGGVVSFIILLGSGRRQVIGRYPIISLSQARTKAKAMLAERTLGKHQPQTISWDAARDEFLDAVKRKNRARTHTEYARTLKRYFPFGSTRLGAVSKQDISRKLDRLNDVPSQQRHALVVAKIFCNWAIKRGYADANPCLSAVHTRAVPRARVLSDAEVKSIWEACSAGSGISGTKRPDENKAAASPQLPEHFKAIVKLLILTGQRRGEIAALRSDYFSNDTCTLPASLTKNGREHTFPIGTFATSILKSALASVSPSDTTLLFPARGKTNVPFNGWSKSKTALDKLSGVSRWTLHDIRRTVATRMAEQGVPIHVIERLLNHITGAMSPIARVYNRATFVKEMRAGVEIWEAHLTKILAAQ